ncbi:MAG: amidohydrolase [Candidatus Cloacimonetes bacterium]|nr:amidohydrolase [Candidatus Cloacimonadota bacterium]
MLDLIKIREDLHQIPELGFQEVKTQKYIEKVLAKFPELIIHRFDFPALVAEYKVGEGSYKLFRADMDALPISEESGCAFSSKHLGKMHACGHDMHMTILLGLIERVINQNIQQNILFVFQPAEEGMGGARRMLDTNFFKKYNITACFALHVNGEYPVGTIASKPGIFFANTREVEVVFQGKSAHVAFSEKGKNALDAGAEFYLALQDEIKEQFPQKKTVICAFGKMEAGTVMNAVPAKCTFNGTIRAFTAENHENIKKLVEEVAKSIARKHELEVEVIYHAYYKEVNNDFGLFASLKQQLAGSEYKLLESEAVFTGEDFGFFAAEYPGLLFWLGANQGEAQDLHSNKFLPDFNAVKVGIDVMAGLV